MRPSATTSSEAKHTSAGAYRSTLDCRKISVSTSFSGLSSGGSDALEGNPDGRAANVGHRSGTELNCDFVQVAGAISTRCAGEKQILLQQLTSMPKLTTIQEVAGALRNWRRHYDVLRKSRRFCLMVCCWSKHWTPHFKRLLDLINRLRSGCLRAGCSCSLMRSPTC